MNTTAQFQGQPKTTSEEPRAQRPRRFSLVLATSLLALAILPSMKAGPADSILGEPVRFVIASASRFVNDVRLIYQIGQLADPAVVSAAQPISEDHDSTQFQDCSLDSATHSHTAKSAKSRL